MSKAERYEVNYEGWIMRGYANGQRQAKYRAWRQWSKTYSTSLIDFVSAARDCKMHEYADFGNISLWEGAKE